MSYLLVENEKENQIELFGSEKGVSFELVVNEEKPFKDDSSIRLNKDEVKQVYGFLTKWLIGQSEL